MSVFSRFRFQEAKVAHLLSVMSTKDVVSSLIAGMMRHGGDDKNLLSLTLVLYLAKQVKVNVEVDVEVTL